MVAYSPRQLFQSSKDRREAWSNLVANPVLHHAISYAVAEMASRGMGPSDLAGVNGFIFTLLNLSEETPKPPDLPIKKLTSFDEPPKPKPTT